MPKKTKAQFKTSYKPVCGVRGKKTSLGRRNVGTSTMNRNKRRSYKKYKGQGK
jgi:hypothetical protein